MIEESCHMTCSEGAAILLIESGATFEVYLLDDKKYASLFHSTLHHNTGYSLEVIIFSNGLFKIMFQNGRA